MTLKAIESAAKKLSLKERRRLAAMLLSTLEDDESVEQAWIEEADRRYRAYLSGRVKTRPWREAIAAARVKLRQ
jgi:Putative addiction module component